jgi:SulP family sulfate permease
LKAKKMDVFGSTRFRAIGQYLPVLDWGKSYDREAFGNDALAAVIVTIMLIPQSLAYALLAGLPAQAGLYASILPIVAYAIFGTSRTLAVGPVAVVSLMTAAAIGNLGLADPASIMAAALVLAFLSGTFLLAMGLFKLGFVANFLSHPVIAGFITASGILIATSQLRHVLGIEAHGHNLVEILGSLSTHLGDISIWTVVIGTSSIAFLFWVRKGLQPVLEKAGLPKKAASMLAKAGPVVAIAVTTFVTWGLGLEQRGVAIVGDIPRGLPPLTVPRFDWNIWTGLFGSAVLISIIGFVESVSVAQTLAAKRRQRITPDQELIGLGAANIAASFSGGYPVTGGFARSVVNFDAGAQTPAAGAYTAVGIALAALILTPALFFLPKAVLAATIIVAVLSLVDFSILWKSWNYSRADFSAVFATIALTLGVGVEAGVSAGVGLSILLYLYRSSKPHIAEVGLLPGTQHFRNILRHKVETVPEVVTIRVDENLYFANARFLEDYVQSRVTRGCKVKHVVLMCSAVNSIDLSALESLEEIDHRLKDMGVKLHLSEVKGPVMDKLQSTHFLEKLSGRVFLSQFDAYRYLTNPGS